MRMRLPSFEANAGGSLEGGHRTRLDQLLDRVKYAQSELTLDTEGYTREQVDQIIAVAKARGFHAAASPNAVLIRDLRAPGGLSDAGSVNAKGLTFAEWFAATGTDTSSGLGIIVKRVNRLLAAERSISVIMSMLQASGIDVQTAVTAVRISSVYRRAWYRGEDPSEYSDD